MFAEFLYTISAFSAVLPLVIGIANISKLDFNSRCILVLLLVASVSQLNAKYNANENDKWMLFNIYSIVDACIWSIVFSRISQYRFTRAAIMLLVTTQLVIFLSLGYVNGLKNRFFYDLVCINSLLQLIWVLSFFYEKYRSMKVDAIEKEPMFWYCLGLLVYCPTTYFLFVFYETARLNEGRWLIHSLLNTFMYIIFTIGMYANINNYKKVACG